MTYFMGIVTAEQKHQFLFIDIYSLNDLKKHDPKIPTNGNESFLT